MSLLTHSPIVEDRFAAPSNQLHDRTSDVHDFIATIPAILHVCYESRVIGLKYCELAFFHKGCIAPVYFNFEMDILFPRAGCTKRQLEFLARNMDVATTSRIRFLDLYNEHLERARNISTWDAFPHYFSGLGYIRVLFKSFRDPSIIDSAQLPDCVHSALRKPNCPDEAKNDDNPTWRQYQRELLKEKINASLLPPQHLCRYKAKGGSRRTHTLPAELMRWDKRITPGYAEDKVKTYRKNLKKSALAVPFYSDRPYGWTCPDIWYGGLCEHGLVFEAAPGLEFTGRFLNEFQ